MNDNVYESAFPLSPIRAKILAQGFSPTDHNSPADWARELLKAKKILLD